MDLSSLKLIVFDMAGTTVDDNINGVPLVVAALQQAFKKRLNIIITLEQVNPHRGKAKLEAIRCLLAEVKSSSPDFIPAGSQDDLSKELFDTFIGVLDELTEKEAKEMPGTSELFALCKKKGIKVAVGSGFPQKTVDGLVKHLGWKVDYVGSVDRVKGKSRPNPAMIYDAMNVCGVSDPSQVLKVGDTQVDIQEAKNAKVRSIGVLSGTQSREDLLKKNPDAILSSVAELIVMLNHSRL